MARAADEMSDIVQERGGLEEFSRGWRQLVHRLQYLKEPLPKTRNVPRMFE
jgi:hypothetical protein